MHTKHLLLLPPLILLAAAAPQKTDRPTWHRDIGPLVRRHCSGCHREGEIGPFPLQKYTDVLKRLRQVSDVVARRIMPPWKADSHGQFKGERRLRDDEMSLFSLWVQQAAPEGDPLPEPPFDAAPAWRLGTPDTIVRMPAAYTVKSEGGDVYRCFVMPNELTEDAWISAIEVKPGNPRVVHHVNLFVDRTGTAEKMDAADPEPGFKSSGFGPGFPPTAVLGGWTPGRTTGHLPEGVGVRYPAGGRLVMEVHYHPTGRTETDQTSIGIYFCRTPVQKRLRVLSLMNQSIRIPPNDANVKVKYGTWIPADITLLDVTPHMHFLGRSMTVTATLPGSILKGLVSVPDWDYRWQTVYEFVQPIKLPRGTRLDVEAVYDNSRNNPRNPNNPPKWVYWGEGANEEMCTAFLGFTVDAEDLLKGIRIPKIHPLESGSDR
jgi:hypothetical protein